MKRIFRLLNKQKNSQRNTTQSSASTPMDSASGKLPEQTLPDSHLKSSYHRSCETLKYDTFLKVLISGDLNLLTITGFPTEEELGIAWDAIQEEYSTLIATPRSTNVFELAKRISKCNFLIKFIGWATSHLKTKYSEQIALRIQDYGYPLIEKDAEQDRGNLKQIYMVESEAKTNIILLNQYTNEYKMLYPEGETPVDRTLMDYDKELAILSRFMGKWIRRKKITVWEFCTIVNAYMEYNKANKKQ